MHLGAENQIPSLDSSGYLEIQLSTGKTETSRKTPAAESEAMFHEPVFREPMESLQEQHQ